MWHGLVDLAFPPLCAGCGEYCAETAGICTTCQTTFDRFNHPICLTCEQEVETGTRCTRCGEDGFVLFTLGRYVDPLKEAIIHLKFRGVTSTAAYFASEIAKQHQKEIVGLSATSLVPVPLHQSREQERGYNQAALLAKELSAHLGIGMSQDILVRVRNTKPQMKLGLAQREENIKGAFEIIAEADEGESILLVDDVVTGGFTVREAKRTLIAAGFQVVGVISIAHAE